MLDFTTDLGRRAAERLQKEQVAWLTTVGGDGLPQPSPVWFLWEGESALIYSQPNAPKVRNIGRHPQVALNFNSDEHGNNVVILTGEAQIDPAAPAGDQHPAYLEKYAAGIASINMTPKDFATTYSAAIRFTPTKLRGF